MSKNFIIVKNYRSILDVIETEKAIKLIKDFFQLNMAEALSLRRVTAPLFVKAGTGINDDLNGVERPISFRIKNMNNIKAEIVQSLAKWKRLTLANLKINPGEGIYTDMNAVRPDEILDNLHSLYVDQWDWESVISQEERNLEYLKNIVRKIYQVLKKTEHFIYAHYPEIKPILPEEITFIHSEELEKRYPDMSPVEREDAICKECGTVFILGIGASLENGRPHDSRAPDYDDWITPTEKGPGLNGDIIVWYPVLETAFEISSMGIRVDPQTLEKQLEITGTTERKELFFHQKLLNGQLPLSIGGGIGQSRLCMFFLRKAHIGEIQAGLWPEEVIEECQKNNIFLL
ncbi:MAG: aspartate--ammonia ligase [Candidatus Aminicenantes bacterium]|nr:aspartate--ammonia ligase [Candidatus Aminicenantes bacterium]MDH5468334.1 aspartate--ammonia ligase [Candidatus Aminicenantes bacterium]MDH5707248.1 aspartate--ammonia ligase [Candidatus Aminicenantes bacterium]